MKKVREIVVDDRHGYIADWLGLVPTPGARLTARTRNSWRAHRRFRRELRLLASGRRNPIFADTQEEASG